MKILFVIKALANKGGGAERVLCQVASGLAERGHEVTVLTSDSPSATPYYRVNTGVKVQRLGIGNTRASAGFLDTLRRMRCYRSLVTAEQPDVVVAFMHSAFVPAGIALHGKGIPIIASEHTAPKHYSSRPLQLLLLKLVPFFVDRITVVSTQIYESFSMRLRKFMVVIPNPVMIERTGINRVRTPGSTKVLLSVGRLGKEKDHRSLIAAFAEVAERHPDWALRIVGDGNLRDALNRQIQAYGLGHQIQLPGALSAIDLEYEAADLFVISSRYESFGLATAEALLHGVPAIGFADCPGTNELIVDGVNGRLVRGHNRIEALSSVLNELMSNQLERQRLGNAPTAPLAERFGMEAVLERWEDLLTDVIAGRRRKFNSVVGAEKRDFD